MRNIESKNKLYDVVCDLCNKSGITIAGLCASTGLKTQMFTELKSGRTRTMSSNTISVLTKFFGVSADLFILDDGE